MHEMQTVVTDVCGVSLSVSLSVVRLNSAAARTVCVLAMPVSCYRSRLNCRQLLESVTCYDMMPRKTSVVVVDSELPVSWSMY